MPGGPLGETIHTCTTPGTGSGGFTIPGPSPPPLHEEAKPTARNQALLNRRRSRCEGWGEKPRAMTQYRIEVAKTITMLLIERTGSLIRLLHLVRCGLLFASGRLATKLAFRPCVRIMGITCAPTCTRRHFVSGRKSLSCYSVKPSGRSVARYRACFGSRRSPVQIRAPRLSN